MKCGAFIAVRKVTRAALKMNVARECTRASRERADEQLPTSQRASTTRVVPQIRRNNQGEVYVARLIGGTPVREYSREFDADSPVGATKGLLTENLFDRLRVEVIYRA